MLHTRQMPKALYYWFVRIHRSLLSRLQRLNGSNIWNRDITWWKVDRCALRPHGTESYVTKYGLSWLKNVEVPRISLSGTFTLHVVIADVKFVGEGCVCSEFWDCHWGASDKCQSRWILLADRGTTFKTP